MSKTTPVYALPYPEESDSADVPRDVQALAQRLEAVLPNVGMPTGMGADWYAAAAPAGFLICDGSAISRTSYPALFAVLGVTYGGGDGINTFNLPDTRGRVLLGLAPGGNADAASLGRNEGQALAGRSARHQHNSALVLPQHAHSVSVSDPGHQHFPYAWDNAGTTPPFGAYEVQRVGSNHDLPSSYIGSPTSSSPTGIGVSVGGVTSQPGVGGIIGTGALTDGPSWIVANKVIRT